MKYDLLFVAFRALCWLIYESICMLRIIKTELSWFQFVTRMQSLACLPNLNLKRNAILTNLRVLQVLVVQCSVCFPII
jgi:hypothetical protein